MEDPNKFFVRVLEIPRVRSRGSTTFLVDSNKFLTSAHGSHLDICTVGRYSPTKLRNGAFLLAERARVYAAGQILLAVEVNHLLLEALLLARFCSVGRNLVNHLLLKPIGTQDF